MELKLKIHKPANIDPSHRAKIAKYINQNVENARSNARKVLLVLS